MDQFTKVTKQIAQDIEAEDFKLDYSADSVFAKNPITQPIEKKLEEAAGFWDSVFEKIEEYLGTTSLSPNTLKKIKMLFNFFRVKDALTKLNKINKSVDDLVKMKTPYGENEKRYEMLTRRLLKANNLRTQLQRELL